MGATARLSILIVDDDAVDREVIRRYLHQGRNADLFSVREVADAAGAMAACERATPDCLLVDYGLTDLSGLDLVTEMFENGPGRIPVIMLTGQGDELIAVEAMKRGVLDYLPKDQVNASSLSRAICNAVDRFVLQAQVEEQKRQLEADLQRARVAQRSLLPEPLPACPGLRLAARFEPMDEVGGDFYDVFQLPDQQTGMLMADVTGHGVAAALMAMLGAGLFNLHARIARTPGELFARFNDEMLTRIPEEAFLSCAYAQYDAGAKRLQFISAGHPDAIVVRASGEVQTLASSGPMLGMFPSAQLDLKVESLAMASGDKLLLYTDGLIDSAPRATGETSVARLANCVRAFRDRPIRELVDAAYDTSVSATHVIRDDITMLGVEFR